MPEKATNGRVAESIRYLNEDAFQHTEIYLTDFEDGLVTIEPAESRTKVQLQFLQRVKGSRGRLELYDLSPEEAYVIGSSLVEHSKECGYDYDTGETRSVG